MRPDDSSNPLGVPRNILAAARRAGLRYPDWYVGGRQRDVPRKKTLEDIVRNAEAKVDALPGTLPSSEGT